METFIKFFLDFFHNCRASATDHYLNGVLDSSDCWSSKTVLTKAELIRTTHIVQVEDVFTTLSEMKFLEAITISSREG